MYSLVHKLQTHHERGHTGDHRIEDRRRHRALLVRTQERFGVGIVVAEEPLNVNVESVRVLKIVRQHDSPGHDHELEV